MRARRHARLCLARYRQLPRTGKDSTPLDTALGDVVNIRSAPTPADEDFFEKAWHSGGTMNTQAYYLRLLPRLPRAQLPLENVRKQQHRRQRRLRNAEGHGLRAAHTRKTAGGTAVASHFNTIFLLRTHAFAFVRARRRAFWAAGTFGALTCRPSRSAGRDHSGAERTVIWRTITRSLRLNC